ncbi:hypothetical protein HPB48_014993 [Haemaphysalis longicornis]|uniref:Uncharacterized protein n=1 Tax=Haemaphysalis longicornis TaxID=44386 RepID=A0A9J6F7G5_HAELO|nr:hypothetical protein HPB48_014993 [Haemaphysalis longicornis]
MAGEQDTGQSPRGKSEKDAVNGTRFSTTQHTLLPNNTLNMMRTAAPPAAAAPSKNQWMVYESSSSAKTKELLPPRDPYITEPLRKKKLFTISLDREDDDDVICVGGYQGPHEAVILEGDPNVPSGQVTFEVTLLYSMVLTAQQQSSITALNAIEVYEMEPPPSCTQQPFRVPGDCHERFHEVPKTCIARYHALGQVAGHGFTNPSFSRGHWIVFSEDLFGFLWLELLSLSMYHRVKEEIA